MICEGLASPGISEAVDHGFRLWHETTKWEARRRLRKGLLPSRRECVDGLCEQIKLLFGVNPLVVRDSGKDKMKALPSLKLHDSSLHQLKFIYAPNSLPFSSLTPGSKCQTISSVLGLIGIQEQEHRPQPCAALRGTRLARLPRAAR